MKTIMLEIKGLCCVECSTTVERALNNQEGIREVKILTAVEQARITYDEGLIQPDNLVEKIRGLGYPVRMVSGLVAPQEKVEQKPSRILNLLRFAFVSLIALIALVEIGAEWLGLLEMTVERLPLVIVLATIFVGGYPIFKRAILGLRQRQINVDTMMSVGILGAAALSQYTSSLLIVFFMGVAHFLEEFTTGQSRKAIQELIRLAPKRARIKVDGREIEIPVQELKAGDVVTVRPGEQIPADGVVAAGLSSVNQASITGESIPVEKKPGDAVFAATLNERGYLEVEVSRVGPDTTFGKIVRLVEEAEAVKAPVQKFADRFTTYFLPTAVGFAFLTYLISGQALYAIAVLVAACPCAMGLATPLSVIASVESGAKRGLLIKGGLYLETLARVNCLVMDKTGTVTFGKPQITDIVSLNGLPAEDLLRFAASVEQYSEHPIAPAILFYARSNQINISDAQGFEYAVGKGIGGTVQGHVVQFGNPRLLGEKGILCSAEAQHKAGELENEGKTALFLAMDGQVEGIIAIADVIREEVPHAVTALKRLGIERLILLTGDNERVGAAIARRLGMTEYRTNLLPEDKIAVVRDLQKAGYTVAVVGDGVNDAPALAQADVGIAMGVIGSDTALEAAHVALMREDWGQIPQAIKMGRRTYRTIRQNIILGIAWDVITMGLASVGILSPVLAAATEAVPDVLVSLNSARLLKVPNESFSK